MKPYLFPHADFHLYITIKTAACDNKHLGGGGGG